MSPSTPANTSLSRTVRRGATISAAVLVVVQVVSVAQTIVLGHLLSPAEIGVYTAGTLLTGFLTTFTDGGMKAALIQRQASDADTAAVTVFWSTAVAGATLGLLALAAAPVVGTVFNSAEVGAVAAASAGVLVLHTLTTVPDGLLQRRFDFRRRIIVDPGVNLTFALVAIVLCAQGFGVAGLVVATYVQQCVWIVLTWSLARWWPGRLRPSWQLWRTLARFAFPLALESLAERIRSTAEGVLVGRGLDETGLGYYRYGRNLSTLPGTAVIEIVSYVLFPAFSRLAGDPDRLRRAFLRALRWVWAAAVPVAGLLVALGEPAVVVLLGERWRDAGVTAVAMSGYGLGVAMNAVALEALKGAGHTSRLNWTTAVSLVTGLGLLVVLIPPLGLVGVGLAISVSALLTGVTALWLAHRVVGVPARPILAMMIGPAVAGGVAAAALRWADRAFVAADRHGVAGGVLLLAAEATALVLIYVGLLFVVAPGTARTLARDVRGRGDA